METKVKIDQKVGSKFRIITFWRNGIQVFDFTQKGNIVSFSNGDIILL